MSRLMVNGWFILSADHCAAAMIAGVCLSALAGNSLEWRWKTVARLGAPVIDPERLLGSIGCLTVAGPYLLVNEAIIAHQQKYTSLSFTICALAFAAIWCLAGGILCLEFLWQITHLQ